MFIIAHENILESDHTFRYIIVIHIFTYLFIHNFIKYFAH